METQTGWVKPPQQVSGLYYLGAQAPCISLYGRLLPGITNVTDRARYYSFYPWIIWALEKDGHVYSDEFIEMFRRADCLFTLIAHRHRHTTEGDYFEHAGGMIGTVNLSKPISKIRDGEAVRLSDFSHREGGGGRYFKNKMGGLGQYYLGTLRELSIGWHYPVWYSEHQAGGLCNRRGYGQ